MASVFWDSQRVIMIDFFSASSQINAAYCAGALRRLRQEIARKRRGKLTHSVLLLQDNAHTSQVAMTAAIECGFEILPHPPYFHDMVPSEFYLFPKLKSHFRGTQYGRNEGVIEAVNDYLGTRKKCLLF